MTPFLHTERLVLRPFCREDVGTLVQYRNDPEVARFQSWTAFDEATALAFVEEMAGKRPGTAGEGYQIAVALKQTDALVGDLYLRPLDYDVRQAEIGYTFARTHQGSGYATEAVTGLLDYCFYTLELHRVIAYTAVANERSVKLLKRVGFRREGKLRQSYECAGRWLDEYLYALLALEWRT